MKLDLEQPILTLYGQPMLMPGPTADAEQVEAKLKFPLIEALLADSEENRKLSRNEKMDRWELAKRLRDGGEQEFTSDEVNLAREAVAKMYGITVAGPCLDALGGR